MKFWRGDTNRSGAYRLLVPIYFCGILGPFGGTVMSPMIPELRDSFDTSTATVAWGIGAFFFPFAGLLLVSGTLGERWGRQRTIRVAVSLYAVASLACAASPSLWVFFAGRAAQGSFNAFMTPLLIAALTDAAPANRVGRTIGTYASFQAIGGVLGMLFGGIAADVGWRWAFVVVAAVSLVLSVKFPQVPMGIGPQKLGIRSVLNKKMLTLGLVALTQSIGPGGLQLLVALVGRDVIGLSGSATGALLISGSLMAALVTPHWGTLIDRIGARKATAMALLLSMVAALLLSQIDTTIPLVLVWALAGAAVQCISTGFQLLAAMGSPNNRGGGVSMVLSHRFLGHAIGPLLWVPIFERNVSMAYIGAAAFGAISIAFVYASQHDSLMQAPSR